MKVVILCGGLGTRLREETEFRPKPMLEIGGKPILWHIMKIYAQHGFREFVLCLGYKGEMIKDYFLNYEAMNNDFTIWLGQKEKNGVEFHGNHGEAEWSVTLAETGVNAMTGARVKRIERYIDGPEFFATYGDGVADINMQELLRFHRSHGRVATVTGVHPGASRFGELITDSDHVVRFSEKLRFGEVFVSGGFFVFNRDFFKYLHDGDGCVLEHEPLERMAAEGQLMIYRHPGFWQPMDTLRDWQLLNEMWNKGNRPWKSW